MDLNINAVVMANAFDQNGVVDEDLLQFENYNNEYRCFVALGDTASKFLKGIRVNHFKLPHPSGLNRKLNDKQEISRLLYRCKKYIYE